MHLKHERRQIKREIKHRIIEGLDRSELVKLSFTYDELRANVRWEHSKEFEFKGEMYDVVETEIEGDKVVYWCWWDHAETTLNKQLNNILALFLGQTNGNPNKHDPVSSFMKQLYTVPEIVTVPVLAGTHQQHYTYRQAIRQSLLQDTPSPPPRA